MIERTELDLNEINSGIKILLGNLPSGPDFTQPTVKYCHDSAALSIGKTEIILKRQFPSEAGFISSSLDRARLDPGAPPQSNLFLKEGKIYLESPETESRLPANRILQSVYYANDNLGVFEYGIALYPPSYYPRYSAARHPGFDRRFINVVETGEWSLKSAPAEIMAVAYLTQVAKFSGVDEARILLHKAETYGGVAGPEYIDSSLAKIIRQVLEIRERISFITEGLGTIGRISKQHNIDEDKKQLLLDIAFIKNRAFDTDTEFLGVLRPIVRFITLDNWQQAFSHRDFLLRFFISSFPDWRRKTFQEEAGVKSLESMEQVVKAAKEGSLILGTKEVPDAYKPLFGDYLKKKVEKSKALDSKRILKKSVYLSNEILWRIGQDHVGSIILPSGESYIEISKVSLVDNKQVCKRYGKDSTKNINFTFILYNYIKRVQKLDSLETPNKRINRQRFVKVLMEAYKVQKQLNPAISYSLKDYLRVLIGSYRNYQADDPVWKFIRYLKTTKPKPK